MSFAPVDYEDCGEKCRCQQGLNAGTVYNKNNPCSPDYFFDEEGCDCTLEIPCGEVFQLQGREGQFSDSYIVGNPQCGEEPVANILTFTWEAYGIPDAFEVTGGASYSTNGLVSGTDTVYLPLSGPNVTVNVIGSTAGTLWKYKLERDCGPCDNVGGGE